MTVSEITFPTETECASPGWISAPENKTETVIQIQNDIFTLLSLITVTL